MVRGSGPAFTRRRAVSWCPPSRSLGPLGSCWLGEDPGGGDEVQLPAPSGERRPCAPMRRGGDQDGERECNGSRAAAAAVRWCLLVVLVAAVAGESHPAGRC